jgi:hypothetical protein
VRRRCDEKLKCEYVTVNWERDEWMSDERKCIEEKSSMHCARVMRVITGNLSFSNAHMRGKSFIVMSIINAT